MPKDDESLQTYINYIYFRLVGPRSESRKSTDILVHLTDAVPLLLYFSNFGAVVFITNCRIGISTVTLRLRISSHCTLLAFRLAICCFAAFVCCSSTSTGLTIWVVCYSITNRTPVGPFSTHGTVDLLDCL